MWGFKFNYWGPLVTAIATGFIAWFTLSLRDATKEQGKLTERADEHFQVTERAYVKMSHTSPGINWVSPLVGQGSIRIQIKNFGNTPAEVTDAFVDCMVRAGDHVEALPPYRPDTPGRLPETAFLVKGDRFFMQGAVNISTTQRAAVEAAESLLIIFGFVDYIDKFGTRHRAGYARLYDPSVDRLIPEEEARNNLPIFQHRDYNFDRPRTSGEGDDWQQA